MKIEIFRAIEGNQTVEQDVNTWLAENPGIDVVAMTQSDSGGEDDAGLIISILYREKA